MSFQCPLCNCFETKEIINNIDENIVLINQTYSFYQCNKCELFTQWEIPKEEELTDYYTRLDMRAVEWWNSDSGKRLKKKIIKNRSKKLPFIVQYAFNFLFLREERYPYWRELKQGNILDVGAGSGDFCNEAVKRGFKVNGIEQSNISVERAHSLFAFRLHQEDLNSDFSLLLLREADNITLNHVLEHICEPSIFFETLRNNMKNTSRLIILIPNPNSLWRFIFGSKWFGWDPPVHVHHYTKNTLEYIFNRKGYKILKLTSISRKDSLSNSLNAFGYNLKYIRPPLKIVMTFLGPILNIFGLGQELLCVVEKV